MDSIAKQLLKTGLLQVGLFEDATGKHDVPYRLRLELLAAYPDLLHTAADDAMNYMPQKAGDRLVSAADTIPVSTLISQKSGIPLVYSRGCNKTPVHDLIGAYDVGHPATLIINTIESDTKRFIEQAERVGLHIHTAIVLIDTGYYPDDVTIRSVWSLNDIVNHLVNAGQIPPGQAIAIQDFLKQKNALS